MLLRPFLNDAGSRAGYLFGCTTHDKLAVVDPHADLVDDYLAAAAAIGSAITAVFETHVQADHVSGLPALVERTATTAYLPAGAQVEFEHVAFADGGLSGNPFSSIGLERRHNPLLAIEDPDAFADALLKDAPPRPPEQKRIVAANRSGKVSVPA